MQLENPIAGQRCVHIHATLDTGLLKPNPTNVRHLSNMMVFYKADSNKYSDHTSFKARRQNTGTQLKTVVNVKDCNATTLEFLGVTRDHLADGKAAISHPSSAGMFAVCIDGVVTIRTECVNPEELMPGDFLCVDLSGPNKCTIEGTDGDIETLKLKKAKVNVTIDPLSDTKSVGNFKCDTALERPIGRLVELREISGNLCEFRVNLCPFGAPYAMLDSGVITTNPDAKSIENDPVDGYALTYLDYGAIQPTKEQAEQPATESFFGTVAQQGPLGASQAMTGIVESTSQSEPAVDPANVSFSEWAATHGKSLSSESRGFVEQAVTSSNAKSSVFINGDGRARFIQDATDFRENVLRNVSKHQTIQQGDTTVTVYSAGRKRASNASSSSSAASKKSRHSRKN